MQHRAILLVTEGAKRLALGFAALAEHRECLIGVAGKDHLVKAMRLSRVIDNNHVVLEPVDARDATVALDVLFERRRKSFHVFD